nr:hypothetical protein [Halorientalis persicus]
MSGEQRADCDTDTQSGQPAQSAQRSTLGVLKTAVGRIRHDPFLTVPFIVAGIVVAVADWLRTHDPLPVALTDGLSQTISVQYSVVPQGTARTVRHVGALIDLKMPYLLWAIGLELAVVLVVAIAGWMTIARTLDTSPHLGGLSRYLLTMLAVLILSQLLGSSFLTTDRFLLGLGLLAVFLVVAVRLFLFPANLVTGNEPLAALRLSYRRSRGYGMTIAGLIIVIGLSYWGLAKISHVGGFLSTAVVAPVHAVVLGILVSAKTKELDAKSSD